MNDMQILVAITAVSIVSCATIQFILENRMYKEWLETDKSLTWKEYRNKKINRR